MRLCNCGKPLVGLMAVYQKEYACFSCGNTYEFFNDCKSVDETPELKTQYEEAENAKEFFYDTYKFESDGSHTKSLQTFEFRAWVKKQGDAVHAKGESNGD